MLRNWTVGPWVALAGITLGGCSESPSEEPIESPVEQRAPEPDWTPGAGFPLTEVASASGLNFVHENGAAGRRYYVETMSPGAALFDADGDGDLDVYLVNGAPLPGSSSADAPTNALFTNRGDGTFDDATASSGTGDRGYSNGATAGDYDGDGDQDLYVLNYGPNTLYRNDGNGRFDAHPVGAEDEGWSIAAAFLDFDGDGDLDVYVVNYLEYDVATEKACTAGELEIYCSPERYPPAADKLYENREGRFVDVSAERGIRIDGRGMGLAVTDLEGDGDPDIYVVNDRSENHLYRNEDGTFTDIALESGVGFGLTGQVEGGMGTVAADFTGAGTVALFHTNFQREPNRFYVDSGDGFFDDRSMPSGLGLPSLEMVSWGIAAVDIEGDGDLDLAVGNGHVWDNAAEFIPGSSYAMPDQLFLNDGQGKFETFDFPGTPSSTRGIASGDLDGDGDADLVVTSCGARVQLWRNDAGRAARTLVIELRGKSPNTDAYGARVTATIGTRTLVRDVSDGGSYASHNDPRVYLGLGNAPTANVSVRWPSGEVETVEGMQADQHVVWHEGTGMVESRAIGSVSR